MSLAKQVLGMFEAKLTIKNDPTKKKEFVKKYLLLKKLRDTDSAKVDSMENTVADLADDLTGENAVDVQAVYNLIIKNK